MTMNNQPTEIKNNNEDPPSLLESAIFDHRRLTNPRDHRHNLRRLLAKDELSDEVTSCIQSHPKTCKSRFLFPYPSKRRTVKLFPLARICCLSPSLDLVKLVYETYPDAIAGKDEDGRLPLHYACRFGASKDVVAYLIQQYENAVRIQTNEGVLPLHYACRNQDADIVHDLISLYPESIKVSNKLSWLPLHYACCRESESQPDIHISYLLSLYPDACKVKTKSRSLPLHYAAGWASLQAIKTLVSMYPDAVKSANASRKLPLHHACQQQAPIEVINFLVQQYPDSVTCATSKGANPSNIVIENESPLPVLVYLQRVESSLNTLNSLPFNARCEIMDDMMSEALKETKTKEDKNLGNVFPKSNEEDQVCPNTVNVTDSSPVDTNEPMVPARTAPGAVRVLGPDADEMADDDDIVSYAESETRTAGRELVVASEIAPPVAELEAELESYRQRFRDEVVLADEVVAVPNESPITSAGTSKCCTIL